MCSLLQQDRTSESVMSGAASAHHSATISRSGDSGSEGLFMLLHETSWDSLPPRARPLAGPVSAVPAALLAVAACLRLLLRTVRLEALKEGSYLVPVRIFIGIGWLRAFAEKAVEPGWRDGTTLSTFLLHQLHA